MASPTYNCEATAFQDASGNWDVASCAEVLALNSASAALTSDMTNGNADPTYTAVTAGAGGNEISVVHVDPSGNSQSLAVTVDGTAVTVSLATDASGTITTTCNLLKTAWDASAAVNLATVAVEGTGAGVVNAKAVASLSGGAGGCRNYNRTEEHCNVAAYYALKGLAGKRVDPTG